jgi:hypothetical protein
VPELVRYSGFQTGLFTADGKPKPSFSGFRLPLAVEPKGSKVSVWGLVRPATGASSATLQSSSNGRSWRDLATVRTDARGYFRRSASLVSGRRWRLEWTAPDGKVFHGTATSAHAG